MATTFIQVIDLHYKVPLINFFTWVFDIYLICIILTIVPKKIRCILVFLFSFILYSLAIIDAFCVENFYAKLGSEILNLILDTNKQEASEFMTDDLPHLLLFLAGIHHQEYNESKNLISPAFNSKRKRMLDGKIDYVNMKEK